MISEAFKAIELLMSLYSGKKNKEQLQRHLKQILQRELALNHALIHEAIKYTTTDDSVANGFVKATQISAFEAIAHLGLPLEEIFSNSWTVSERYPPTSPGKQGRQKKHLSKLKNIGSELELIERTYHRLAIQKVRTDLSDAQNSQSLNYLSHLLYECVQLGKIHRHANVN